MKNKHILINTYLKIDMTNKRLNQPKKHSIINVKEIHYHKGISHLGAMF